MSGFDIVVRGGIVVTGGSSAALDLGIRAGRIAAVLEPGAAVAADREIDAAGLVVTPGGIDTHTHVDWPYDGQRTVDGVEGATRAAVLGGTTTIVDFVPPPDEGRTLRAACHDRVDDLAGRSAVDFALHPILPDASAATVGDLPAVIADGFTSFKMYTTYEGRYIDDGAAWRLIDVISRHGGLPGFHAENDTLLAQALDEQASLGHVGPDSFPASRPALAEAEAISMVSLFARQARTPVYIFHVSGALALRAVEDARRAGSVVHAETCTHYLVHDESVFADPAAWRFVISPPIRSVEDQAALWQGVRSGSITSVGSDHCAYSTAAKSADADDHRRIPAGAPGIEARTPLLWSESREHGLSAADFVAVNSERAAAALGLRGKGRIEVGADADVVLWDPAVAWTGADLPTSSPETFTLYDGVAGTGRPRHVLLRGEPVVVDGDYAPGARLGRFVARAPRRTA
jgi:dihydropyrimidinase